MADVAVCVAPIVDPKLPADRLVLRDDGRDLHTETLPRALGPFDEAALEVALRLRDANPGTRISAVMLGGAADEPCLRYAMALRLDTGLRVEVAAEAAWDPRVVCRALVRAIATLQPAPDLVLLGREFGDSDDGVVPPLLAEHLGWRFFGLSHRAVREGGSLVLLRESGAFEERAAFTPPVVASVTNHPENRLRLPLLKNIMAANRQPLAVLGAGPDARDRYLAAAAAETVRPSPRGAGACRLLSGSPEQQASELARFLAPWSRRA